jgi:hypothetical protein
LIVLIRHQLKAISSAADLVASAMRDSGSYTGAELQELRQPSQRIINRFVHY